MALRPTAIRKREAFPKKRARIDAQVTSQTELRDRLKDLDDISGEEAKERLKAVLGIIWDKRKRIAKGRRIRRIEDLRANIRKNEEETTKAVRETQLSMEERAGEIQDRIEGMQMGIRAKTREMETDVEKKQKETARFVKEFYNGTRE